MFRADADCDWRKMHGVSEGHDEYSSMINGVSDDGVFDPYSGVRGLAGAGMLPDECRGAEVSVRDLEVLPRVRTSGRCRSGSRGVSGVAPLVGASVLLRSGFRVVA